jgi:hypothetical protein
MSEQSEPAWMVFRPQDVLGVLQLAAAHAEDAEQKAMVLRVASTFDIASPAGAFRGTHPFLGEVNSASDLVTKTFRWIADIAQEAERISEAERLKTAGRLIKQVKELSKQRSKRKQR